MDVFRRSDGMAMLKHSWTVIVTMKPVENIVAGGEDSYLLYPEPEMNAGPETSSLELGHSGLGVAFWCTDTARQMDRHQYQHKKKQR
jgi:hypothetical protein